MRILVHGINFYPEPVGTGKYTGEMVMWLASRGHEVRMVTSPPHNPHWRVPQGWSCWKYVREQISAPDSGGNGVAALSVAEIDVFRCPIWVPRSPSGLKRLIYLASFGLSSCLPMLKQLRWRPDVVIMVEPTLFCSFQTLLVASLTRAKAWLHIQDFEVDAAFELDTFSSAPIRRCAVALERFILSRFDRVSTISDRMMERLMTKGVERPRCVYFPNWVNTQEIRPLPGPNSFRRELGIDEHTIVALYSGSMGNKQGFDLLVEAARRLSDRNDLRFVFCGEGSYRQKLAEMVKDLPNVFLMPVQPADRLNELLNFADIHLLPQRADAADLVMPSKLTGMLASGRPVLATAAAGTQLERAVSGRGLVVQPEHVEDFIRALLRLTLDKNLRNRLGEEGRTYSLTYLDSWKVLAEFENVLLSLHSPQPKGKEGRRSGEQSIPYGDAIGRSAATLPNTETRIPGN